MDEKIIQFPVEGAVNQEEIDMETTVHIEPVDDGSEPEELVEDNVETSAEESEQAESTEAADTDKAKTEATEPTEAEEEQLIDDPDDPLKNMAQIESMLENTEAMVTLMEQQWLQTAKELDINDTHMRMLTDYNEAHKIQMPDDLTEKEKDEWDHWNGISEIPMEEIERIFGKDHKIIKPTYEETLSTIKSACNDFLAWLTIMREYRNIHDAYLQLLELQEEQQINELRKAAEQTTDPAKKEVMTKSIEDYYNNKYLGFLAEPLTQMERDRLLNGVKDPKKLEYWIKRTRDKLDQLKISNKFILEVSQFEKRFLDEKYHVNNNMLLVWFLNQCAFCDTANKRDLRRTRVVCFVMAMDAIIRRTWPESRINQTMGYITLFEDQFLPYISEAHEVTPPTSNPVE